MHQIREIHNYIEKTKEIDKEREVERANSANPNPLDCASPLLVKKISDL